MTCVVLNAITKTHHKYIYIIIYRYTHTIMLHFGNDMYESRFLVIKIK